MGFVIVGYDKSMYFNANFKMPKAQQHFQKTERDCGVAVFAALTGVGYDEILKDLPEAHLGTVTVDGWKRWLEGKGFVVTHRDKCPADIVPCAHLVAPADDTRYCHWVYRDADGDIHDPSAASAAMPADDPWMKELRAYECKVLTISLSR